LYTFAIIVLLSSQQNKNRRLIAHRKEDMEPGLAKSFISMKIWEDE
jgi:hypothetical protein